MNMLVLVNKEVTDIRLTKDAITAAVRSRLREVARLYTTDRIVPSLAVTIKAFRLAFSIQFSYIKTLDDRASGQSWGAVTWSTDNLGMHGNDASYILGAVRKGEATSYIIAVNSAAPASLGSWVRSLR